MHLLCLHRTSGCLTACNSISDFTAAALFRPRGSFDKLGFDAAAEQRTRRPNEKSERLLLLECSSRRYSRKVKAELGFDATLH